MVVSVVVVPVVVVTVVVVTVLVLHSASRKKCSAPAFSVWMQFPVPTGKMCELPRGIPLVTRMLVLSEQASEPVASSSVNLCRKTRTVPDSSTHPSLPTQTTTRCTARGWHGTKTHCIRQTRCKAHRMRFGWLLLRAHSPSWRTSPPQTLPTSLLVPLQIVASEANVMSNDDDFGDQNMFESEDNPAMPT